MDEDIVPDFKTRGKFNGTLIWNMEVSTGMMSKFSAPYSDEDGEITEEEFEDFKYAVLARFHFLLRSIEGYYTTLLSLDDQLGSAIFGLLESNPLQFLKFDYDNFSGFERLSIPRPYESVRLPAIMTKMSSRPVKLHDFFNGPEGVRGSAKHIQRLLTGLCNPDDVEHWQKVLFEKEKEYLQPIRDPFKNRHFMCFISRVENDLYREFRIDADTTFATGCLLTLDDEQKYTVITLLLRKRAMEVPQYEQEYKYLIDDVKSFQPFIVTSLFVLPYMNIIRFEEENFASGYEWTKPKTRESFAILPGDIVFERCDLDELSDIHSVILDKKVFRDPLQEKIHEIKRCRIEMDTDVECLIKYVSSYITYFTQNRDVAKIYPFSRCIDGLFHAISMMQYREHYYKLTGLDSINLLTVIHHCLDPDIRFSHQELVLIEMWKVGIATFESIEMKVAYVVNFVETAKRIVLDKTYPKKLRRIFRDIVNSFPKLGRYFKTRTLRYHQQIPICQLVSQEQKT